MGTLASIHLSFVKFSGPPLVFLFAFTLSGLVKSHSVLLRPPFLCRLLLSSFLLLKFDTLHLKIMGEGLGNLFF